MVGTSLPLMIRVVLPNRNTVRLAAGFVFTKVGAGMACG